MMPIAGIGFLMKYVLLPGFKRNEFYGRDVELYFWGIDRHQWGAIHLILSIVLLILLVLHIVLHWKQIVAIFKNMIGEKFWRFILTGVFVLISIFFFVTPLFVKPEVVEGVSHNRFSGKEHSRNRIMETTQNEQIIQQSEESHLLTIGDSSTRQIHKEHKNNSEIEIFGYMTLHEVAEKYNIPVAELELSINIPGGYSSEKLGRLRKKYDFHLSELRDYIEKKIN
jgi:uncharacterized membrane protein